MNTIVPAGGPWSGIVRQGQVLRTHTLRASRLPTSFTTTPMVTAEGGAAIALGVSPPGCRVALRAEMDALAVISNCPQVNNPCNGFKPTPIRVEITC